MGIHHFYGFVLWTVLISVNVCAEVEFLQRHVGESVVVQCKGLPGKDASPHGVRLKRRWLRQDQVLYMHENGEPFVSNPLDRTRISVSGDPSIRQLNVTISDLRASDTDSYRCEFVVAATPDDRTIPGEVEYFIYVTDGNHSSLDVVHVETCAGSSAVLPCTRPPGEGRQAAVEGFSLKRQKSSGPVEVLYHSKYHQQQLVSSTAMLPPASSSSPFPADRLRLTTVPTVGGMVFNLTVLNLQPSESGYYSCTLLLASRPLASVSLGSPAFYVSVQGGQCDCSSYSTLLYALFAGVAVMLLLLILVICWVRGRTRVKPQAQVAIYEEMVGVRSPKPKQVPCGLGTFHLEEADVSDYSNSLVSKPRAENHYESPSLARISQG